MPVAVVFRCEICGSAPGPETRAGLERQLLDLRHGEYVDVEPGRWLIWHGRGIYGPTRYACGDHRGELSPAPGRPRLFKSTGMAWEDLVLATAVHARA